MTRAAVVIKTYGDAQMAAAMAAVASRAEIRRLEDRLAFCDACDAIQINKAIEAMNIKYAKTWRPGPVAAKLWGLVGLICSRKGA